MNTHIEIIEYYRKVRKRTMRVLTLIPSEKADWSYLDGKFTLADQIRHIALIERDMFMETFCGRPSRYTGCGSEFAHGLDSSMQLLENIHLTTLAMLENTTADQWNIDCLTPTGYPVEKRKWIQLMIEHEIHHRAHVYLYLNMLGIQTTPMYGLTAEKLQSFSRQ